MAKFKVDVFRSSIVTRDIEVEADNEEEAVSKALTAAGNTFFDHSKGDVDYSTGRVTLVEN